MRKSGALSYTARMIRTHRPDDFLACLFMHEPARRRLYALYALDIELQQVRHHVSEEMLAQIRYAWWEEALADIATGKKPKEHPVLQAVAEDAAHGVPVKLATAYREHYPDLPPNGVFDEMVNNIASTEPGWQKARKIIAHHRQRFRLKKNVWLHVKLLWMGHFS